LVRIDHAGLYVRAGGAVLASAVVLGAFSTGRVVVGAVAVGRTGACVSTTGSSSRVAASGTAAVTDAVALAVVARADAEAAGL
jgi:hypothetical protein